MLKRKFISVFFVLLLSMTLISCENGNSKKEEEKVQQKSSTDIKNDKKEIVFWHAMGGKNGEAVNALVEDFNNSQDEILVKA